VASAAATLIRHSGAENNTLLSRLHCVRSHQPRAGSPPDPVHKPQHQDRLFFSPRQTPGQSRHFFGPTRRSRVLLRESSAQPWLLGVFELISLPSPCRPRKQRGTLPRERQSI